MIKKIDYGLCGLLGLGSLGHFFGTIKFSEVGTSLFAWSMSGVLACVLLTVLNLLRINRPNDREILWLTRFGNLGWLVVVLLFGISINNFLDFRVLFHGTAALGLLFLSFLARGKRI